MLNLAKKDLHERTHTERSDASHPDAAGGWTDGGWGMLVVPDRA